MQTRSHKTSARPKKAPKLRLKKADPKQSQRFIEAAREAGASEDEAIFDENLKRITKPKPKEEREPRK